MGFDPAKNHAGPCWVLYRRRRPFTALDGIANVATTTTAWSLLGRRRVPPPASRNDSVGGRNTLSSIQLRRMVNSIQLDLAIHSKWEFPKKCWMKRSTSALQSGSSWKKWNRWNRDPFNAASPAFVATHVAFRPRDIKFQFYRVFSRLSPFLLHQDANYRVNASRIDADPSSPSALPRISSPHFRASRSEGVHGVSNCRPCSALPVSTRRRWSSLAGSASRKRKEAL